MSVIYLGDNDYSQHFVEILEMIANKLNVTLPSEQDVWELMRQSKSIPNASEVFLDLAISRIDDAFNIEYPDHELSYYINLQDSHVLVDGELIQGHSDWERVINISSDD